MEFENDIREIAKLAELCWISARDEKYKFANQILDIKYKYETLSAKFLICEFAYLLGTKTHFLKKGYIKDKKEIEFIEKIIQIAINELQ